MAGLTWLLVTNLSKFVLPIKLASILGVGFIILTVINHIGSFIAIRRHDNKVMDVMAMVNTSIILRREKKAFFDMLVIIVVLVLCLVPSLVYHWFDVILSDGFEPLQVLSTNLIYINSSLNPIIYLVRNVDIRRALKSLIRYWVHKLNQIVSSLKSRNEVEVMYLM